MQIFDVLQQFTKFRLFVTQWWAKYYFQNSIFIFKIQNSILFCILKYFFQSILFCIFKILLKTIFQSSKYFFQNTLNNVFSRKPVSFRLLRVTVSQNFVSVFNIPISINYQSNTSTSIRFACRKFWIVAAQLYGLHAPRRRWIWRIWRQDSRTCQTPTRRITHFPISKN